MQWAYGLAKGYIDVLITAYFSYAAWSIPVILLMAILLFVAAAAAAVYAPIKGIGTISITETINEL